MVKAQDFNGNDVFEVDRFAPKPKQLLQYDKFISTPEKLRIIFKKWKSEFTDARIRGLEYGDAERPSLTRIPDDRLAVIFNRFLQSGVSKELPDVPSEYEAPDTSIEASESQTLTESTGYTRPTFRHKLRCDNCGQIGHRWEQCVEPCQACEKAHTGQLTCSSCGLVQLSSKVPGLMILPSLLPPAIQKKLLSHLLHRDLSNPNHKTNLHLHYDINYPERKASFFSSDPSTFAFRPKDPEVHSAITVKAALDKKLRWTTLGGQYDWTKKEYPAEEPPEFPSDIAELVHSLFPDMKPQAAIVNIYSAGDTLMLHRDVSEEVDRGLVSISLGCDAIFIIGLEDEETGEVTRETLRLRSGDAVYMSGKSRFAWHGVPKILSGTCPTYLSDWPGEDFPDFKNWMENKRINLNIRQMLE